MNRKSTISNPQSRGLVPAVAIFALAVLGGAAWMVNRSTSGEPAMLEMGKLLPDMQTRLRAARTSSGPLAPPDPTEMDATDRITMGLASRGAIVGKAVALRGDLLEVNGQRIRLINVDEARGYAHCGPSAYNWECGTTPQKALTAGIGKHLVGCLPNGTNEVGERLAQCYVGTVDLGGWLIENGMGFSSGDRLDYRVHQTIAKRERRGYWQTQQG